MDGHSGALVMQGIEDNNSPTSNGPPVKRRRKNDGEPSEPRRLRRSHEACTRCRGKKIKCDSKRPKCGSCVVAGVPCNQEDRHRQTTISRDHTERLEQLVSQCDALLKRHVRGFSLQTIDDICAREGIDISDLQPIQNIPAQTSSSQLTTVQQVPSQPAYVSHPPSAGVPYYQYPSYIHPPPFEIPPIPPPSQAQPPPTTIPGQDPKANDMSSTQALAKSFGVATFIVNDTSTSPVLSYYTPTTIHYNTSNPPPATTARLAEEDLAVGSSGLDSGRDRVVQLEMPAPRDTAKWTVVSVIRSQPFSTSSSIDIWLPTDRTTLLEIVNVYFSRLNPHRPVFFRHQFLQALDQLYNEGASTRPVFDPGFICSLYLVLALGTLSELNRSGYQGEASSAHADVTLDNDESMERIPTSPRSQTKAKKAAKSTSASTGISRLPPDWPAHDEFFDRALAVKPELRVTLSSLQALILLQWYLYAERQGRTLWRLVGSIVRLAIELGLHHDPTTQTMPDPNPSEEIDKKEIPTFSPLECTLRIRLWSIVLVHDRGTSILLGRPLAISPSDANTPRPSQIRKGDPALNAPPDSSIKPPNLNDLAMTEHFLLSAPIAEIQADIIMSLYSPTRQSGETLLRNASRIIKSISLFRHSLPPSYKYYFTGTANWTLSQRHDLLSNLTESAGLTLLKLAISRILLLRALFSSKELGYVERRKALINAVVQAHNVIAIHTVLVRYPEVGFFTSPVPLHIAAMVILYGKMSECDKEIPGLSDGEGDGASNAVRILMEDVWLALDMLPRFRWRWETGSGAGAGTNPLIAKLAEIVMDSSYSEAGVRGFSLPDETEHRSSTGTGEHRESRESRLISGIGRQGPVGQPVLIPEPEWEEESPSPREKANPGTPLGPSGPWVDTGSPGSQHTTPTLAPPPPSYPRQNGTAAPPYTYPPPAPTAHPGTNMYPHPQYTAFAPPVFGPQPASNHEKPLLKNVPVSSAANGSSTPVTPTRNTTVMPNSSMHMVELPESLFYPFYQPNEHSSDNSSHVSSNGPLSPPLPLRTTRTTASGAPTAASNGSNGTTSSLLAAVAVQAHALGRQQGAPDMYMNEEMVVQASGQPPMGAGYPVGTYQYSAPPPPTGHHQPEPSTHVPGAPATSQQHPIHPVNGGLYLGGHPMPPQSAHWAPHGHPPSRATGYAAQPSS